MINVLRKHDGTLFVPERGDFNTMLPSCDKKPIMLVDVVTENLNQFLDVELPSVEVTIVAAYTWPNGNTRIFLDELYNLGIGRTNSLLVGDLNLNQLEVSKHKKLNDFLEDNSFWP